MAWWSPADVCDHRTDTVVRQNGHGRFPRRRGQTRFELLLDDDFQFLEDLGVVFGSTGRNDDFCAAVVPVLAG